MPKLKFLDSKMITKNEWNMIHSNTLIHERQQVHNKTSSNRTGFWASVFKSSSSREEESIDEVDNNCYNPLPIDDDNIDQEPRSSYNKLKHFYKGTESQGNRFISNKML